MSEANASERLVMIQKLRAKKVCGVAALALGLLFSSASLAGAQQETARSKKLIELGWGSPDTATLRAHLVEMEKTPFAGIAINVTGKDDAGNTIAVRQAFSNVPWKKAWFQSSIDDLKAIRSKKLTDNFIQVGANPGNVEWFDDAGWKQVVEHWRIAAQIAKEGGLKGIFFDPEPYERPNDQLDYFAQSGRDKHTLEEYQVKARQRGKEIISVVAAVDPSLKIFTLYMNSANAIALKSSAPDEVVRLASFNLYPAFINGWLDAAPPTMIFVDGCEMASYYYNNRTQYLEGANMIRNEASALVAPENRAKYRAQVQNGPAFYLDAYTNPPESAWYIDSKGSTPAARLAVNAQSAVEASDEYVWIYGEKYRWWPTGNGSVSPQSWEDAMPGINDALVSAVNPEGLVQRKIDAAQATGSLVNLLQNGNFAKPTAGANAQEKATLDWGNAGDLTHWSNWQADNSKGSFGLDDKVNRDGSAKDGSAKDGSAKDGSGAARLSGVGEGCLIQTIKVKPGEVYAFRAWTRKQGQGANWVRVRWMTEDSKWTNLASDVQLFPTKSVDGSPWSKIEGTITVPEGSGQLLILLNAKYQTGEQNATWYDDVQLYRIN
jgi:hypothetical protein